MSDFSANSQYKSHSDGITEYNNLVVLKKSISFFEEQIKPHTVIKILRNIGSCTYRKINDNNQKLITVFMRKYLIR